MNKLLKILLVCFMTIGIMGCSKNDKDLLTTIQERGTIIVATEGTWSPWTYYDEDNNLVGFDVEVMKAIASKLGVECEFVVGEWDGLLAGVDAKRFDLVANGVEIDEDRKNKYNFTEPYAYIRTALIVRKDKNDIQTFEDLEGKTTTNSLGSTYAKLAESYGATNTAVDDLNKTFELVLQGRVDATLNAELSFDDYLKAHPDANLEVVDLTETASHVALPLRKDESTATLIEAINKAIQELRIEGKLSEISNKYFGKDITKQ